MSAERSLGERVNTWAQIVGIVLAGVWAVYAFIHKEVLVPQSAPVNVSLETSMEMVTGESSSPAGPAGMLPVRLKVTARNPSSRTVDLLPSIAVVRGRVIERGNHTFDATLRNGIIAASLPTLHQRHVQLTGGTIVAAGNVVPDSRLNPAEAIARTVLFYIPADQYDVLSVDVIVPTTSESSDLDLQWVFDQRDGKVLQRLFRRGLNGQRAPLRRDAGGDYFDLPEDFQQAQAHYELSVSRTKAARQ